MKEETTAKSHGICNCFVTSVLSVKHLVPLIFLHVSSKIQVSLRHRKTFLCLAPVTYRSRLVSGVLLVGNTRSA